MNSIVPYDYDNPVDNPSLLDHHLQLPICFVLLGAPKRMEKLALRSFSSWAKVTGTIASISGALIVVMYKGLQLTSTPLQFNSLNQPLNSQQMKWLIGGLLLVAEDVLISIWYIVQVHFFDDTLKAIARTP